MLEKGNNKKEQLFKQAVCQHRPIMKFTLAHKSNYGDVHKTPLRVTCHERQIMEIGWLLFKVKAVLSAVLGKDIF